MIMCVVVRNNNNKIESFYAILYVNFLFTTTYFYYIIIITRTSLGQYKKNQVTDICTNFFLFQIKCAYGTHVMMKKLHKC